MWSFVLMIFCLIGGAVLLCTIVIVGITVVYSLPYATWLGLHSGKQGIPKNAGQKGNLFHQAKNATKLYRSWITHTPHGITDW